MASPTVSFAFSGLSAMVIPAGSSRKSNDKLRPMASTRFLKLPHKNRTTRPSATRNAIWAAMPMPFASRHSGGSELSERLRDRARKSATTSKMRRPATYTARPATAMASSQSRVKIINPPEVVQLALSKRVVLARCSAQSLRSWLRGERPISGTVERTAGHHWSTGRSGCRRP